VAARRPAPEPASVVLSDPRAIRALAHPARLTILAELGEDTELTATELADRAGITPSAMSYHLRALEKVGIVARADSRGDGRERPWRITNHSIEIASTNPEATAPAEELVIAALLDRVRHAFGAWLRAQEDEPEDWRDAGSVRRARLWLTAAETAALAAAQEALFDRYRERRDPAARPDGTRQVDLVSITVPVVTPSASRKGRRRSASS
jgi:DNA-binding transcriptional ArsR family regulator